MLTYTKSFKRKYFWRNMAFGNCHYVTILSYQHQTSIEMGDFLLHHVVPWKRKVKECLGDIIIRSDVAKYEESVEQNILTLVRCCGSVMSGVVIAIGTYVTWIHSRKAKRFPTHYLSFISLENGKEWHACRNTWESMCTYNYFTT